MRARQARKICRLVAKFRAPVTPCSFCGHVMEMSDDGGSVTVCPCVYNKLCKATAEASDIMAGCPMPRLDGIKLFVVNTEKAPYRILDLQHQTYGPPPLADALPLMQFMDKIYERLTKIIAERTLTPK